MSESVMPTPDWTHLSPEQKREHRFSWYLNPEGVKFADSKAAEAYSARAKRFVDVFKIQEPDRVPVILNYGALPFNQFGIEYREGINNFEIAAQVYRSFNERFALDLDSFSSPASVIPGAAFELLDYKLYLWPGHGLPNNAAEHQFVEGEYMQADEYDDLILNPSDFWMRTYLPRIFGSLGGLQELDSLTDIIEIPMGYLMSLTKPAVLDTLRTLVAVGQELQKRIVILSEFGKQGIESGYPVLRTTSCRAPFDLIGDSLRGTQGIMKDMYRCPDKILEAMDVIGKLLVKSVLAQSNREKALMVGFALHKGADGWMSQKQFETFYWPQLKKIINAFIEEGLIVRLFAEGSFNSRLDSVNEFPKGTVHWYLDRTDMVRAKNVLGSKCSIQGNVPVSLLMIGSPAEVKEHCRKLIEICGKGGGYILSPGSVNINSNIENLKAMIEAAAEYGVYKKN
jgi:hypothetical protein